MKNKQEELIASLKKCTVSGNVVSLPPISSGPLLNYPDVKKALINAGGKYVKNTFVFPADAQPYIDRLTGGESVNIKKEFQFFGTPDALADKLVEMADIVSWGCLILEPSAGQGAIVKAIKRKTGVNATIHCCELMKENQEFLKKIEVPIISNDFLLLDESHNNAYDYVVANPPFNRNQDIDHIRKMYEVLKPGGIMVSVASKHWKHSSNKKETAFREWLDEVGAEIEDVDAGAFKESGTGIATVIIKIRK